MRARGLGLLIILMHIFAGSAFAGGKPVKIACIGGETLPGSYQTPAGSFPGELKGLLGEGYELRVFGAESALPWEPDVVLIEPGRTDSAGGEGTDALLRAVSRVSNIRPKPRVIILLPAPLRNREGDSLLVQLTLPKLRSVAFASGCELVDTHSALLGSEVYGSGLSMAAPPGARLAAARIRDVIVIDRVSGFDVKSLPRDAASDTSFYGYACRRFRFEGRDARIVLPKRTAKGCPWIWRARFWGHEPQTEIALLERGFHVAYCDVAELFGNNEAVGIWDRFFAMLTRGGLSKKAVLEGLSRGGMYVYRWAVRNPSHVACIYADAPVLDMKSWPGGKGKGGGNPVEWETFKSDFGLTSEEEALAFRGNPIDMTAEIAQGGYPMLHICGTADPVVPIEENTDPFEKKILASGGRITVIRKPGIGHHPHSLPNPQPIVDFILASTARY
jgi:pimeloyl-ACP methyl ester carboxylesterase